MLLMGLRLDLERRVVDVEVLGGALAELVEDAADAVLGEAASVTVTCAERDGMPLVMVQACRSWTSATPGRRPGGAHVVEVEALRGDLEQDDHRVLSSASARGRISTAITSDAIGSARVKPVAADDEPARTASSDPSRSARTSFTAPRRLRLPVSDRFRIASEMRVGDQPDQRERDHRPGVDVVGAASRRDAGVREVAADHQQHHGVHQRGEDLGAVQAERRARAAAAASRRTTPRARAPPRRRRWPCDRRRRAAPATR